MALKRTINWTNTLFLLLVPIVAVVGTILLSISHKVHWGTWLLTGVLSVLVGISITGGYHRLFAHRSFNAKLPLRLFFLLFGAAAFEGSLLEWSTDRRNHHRYTDTDKDPYDISKGFWYAHIGWLFVLDTCRRDFSNVEDLSADPWIRWQHQFFIPLAFFMSFILPVLIAGCWGDWWAGLIVAGALRVTFSHHTTFFINSVCHLWGKRTYSNKQSARDNWLTAILTFGEGYHNFHHQFPIDYRNGVRFYHFDPTKWLIKIFSWLRLTQDLKTVSAERIVRYRLQADEHRVASSAYQQKLQTIRDYILELLQHIEQLEQNFKRYKLSDYKLRARYYRHHLKNARRDLRANLVRWTALLHVSKLTSF